MNKILLAIRIKDWWYAIIAPVIAFYFIGLQYSENPLELNHIYKAFYLLLLSMGVASFGFYLNEWTDIEEDIKAGKNNHVAGFTKIKAFLTFLFIITFTLITTYPFWQYKIAIVLFAIQILLLCIYSCPPIRLKRSPYIALFLDSLYSGTIFFIIALLYSNAIITNKLILFTIVFGICRGLRNIIFHIDKDIVVDQKAGQKTIAHLTSSQKLYRLQSYLFIPEMISLLIIIYPTSIYTFYILLLGVVILLVKINYYHFYVLKEITKKKKWLAEINTLYEVWLPIAVIIGTIYVWGAKAIFLSCVFIVLLFPNTYIVFHELYLLMLNIYFVGYKIFYIISDLYFIHTKPHFDIGKWWRKLRGKNEHV